MPHVDTAEFKRQVKKWASEIGIKKAELKMIRVGLSFSIAQQLARGSYVSEPQARVTDLVKKAMGK